MTETSGMVSIFSEFILGFRENGHCIIPIWQSEPKLQRNMQRLLEMHTDTTEEFWARYFLKALRGNAEADSCCSRKYAQGHLCAYLQRTCYYVALQLGSKHRRVDFLRRLYTDQDYFQIANSSASNPSQLLRNFKFNLPSKVKAYARQRLEGIVIGEIRRHNKQVHLEKYENWGLLRNAGVTELRKSLEGRINLDKVEQYVLAWQCFKEIYAPKTNTGSRQLVTPSDEEFQQIVQCYNQRRLKPSEPGEEIDESRVRRMLEVCISAVRDWRKVRFSYPDTNRDIFGSGSEYGWETILQDSPDYRVNDPLARLEQQEAWVEKQEAWHQINDILSQAFSQLSTHEQSLLRLWKPGLGLTQVEIGIVLNLKQYQVNRQCKRCQRSLFKNVAQGCSKSFNLELSNEVIAQLDVPLQEWLDKHCQEFLNSLLEPIVISIDSEERRLLKLYYCQNLDIELIGQEFAINSQKLAQRLENIKKIFLTNFTNNLAADMQIHSDSLAPVAHRIDAFVENWLHTIACPLY